MKVTISFESRTASQQGAVSQVHVSVKDARGHLTYESLVRQGNAASLSFELPEEDAHVERIEIATTCLT